MEPKDTEPTQDTASTSETSTSTAPKSNRFKLFLIILTVLLIGGGVVAGIMLTKNEANNQDSEATAPSAQVVISTGAFTPSTIQVKKGQGVVWINQDDQPHALRVDSEESQASEGMGSEEQINQGESYSFVFNQAGTFSYYDANDPLRFKGVIIVE
jgi:plastocyanin